MIWVGIRQTESNYCGAVPIDFELLNLELLNFLALHQTRKRE